MGHHPVYVGSPKSKVFPPRVTKRKCPESGVRVPPLTGGTDTTLTGQNPSKGLSITLLLSESSCVPGTSIPVNRT